MIIDSERSLDYDVHRAVMEVASQGGSRWYGMGVDCGWDGMSKGNEKR